jgi:hypothetical protein
MTASNSATYIETLTALLRHFEWSPTSKLPGRYEIWSPEEQPGEEEILVPLDPSRGDYAALAERAHRSMLAHYGRAAREVSAILEMRTNAFLDTTQWKKETALNAGIIGWEEGETLYLAARSQLVASAKATKEARRYHGNASAYVAKQFLEGSFMGQTDIGSFIITAYTPAQQRFYTSRSAEDHANEKPVGLFETERVSGREILDTFERALKAVRSGLDEYRKTPRVELFLEAVPEGVSYEFAKALSEITRTGNSAIQIIRQSSQPNQQSSTTEIEFDATEAPILDRVANAFALDPEPQNVTLIGEVTFLSRSEDTRVIRLNIEDGADIRKARVRLTVEQYEMAIEAHHHEASLKVSGSLEREGKLYWLYNASDISIVDNSETYESPPSAATVTPSNPNDPTLFDDF